MATVAEINAELTALIDEISAWRAGGLRRHNAALHTPENAASDKGGMKYCPGCRAAFVTQRLAELMKYLEDTAPQKRLNGKNKRDATLERLVERRAQEA